MLLRENYGLKKTGLIKHCRSREAGSIIYYVSGDFFISIIKNRAN